MSETKHDPAVEALVRAVNQTKDPVRTFEILRAILMAAKKK